MKRGELMGTGRAVVVVQGSPGQPGEVFDWTSPVINVKGRQAVCRYPLAGGWWVEYVLSAQQGMPVVSELRITRKGELPLGGITSRLIREVKIASHMDEARKLMRATWDWPEVGSYERHGFTTRGIEQSPRPGRRGHPDVFYAELAAAYVEKLAKGSRRPVADLASGHRHLSAARASELIHRAREKGMLTPGPQGKAGGELTEKARMLLDQRKTRKRRGK
jgi:hypothetical protein